MIQKIKNFSAWHRQRLIKKIIVFLIVAALITILGFVAWFLIYGEFMQVDEIKVSGTRMVLPADIIALMEDGDSRRGGLWGFIFPENHQFIFKNNEELFQFIQRRFPRVAATDITHDYENRTISIIVTERREVATWCTATDNTRHCFWINDEGLVLDKAPDSRGTLIPVITDKTHRDVFLGRRIIDQEKLKNLIKATEMISEFGWATQEIIIDDSLLQDAVITVVSGQKVFISLLRSPETNGRPILTEMALSGKWTRVKHIDLRIEDRGFYTLR